MAPLPLCLFIVMMKGEIHFKVALTKDSRLYEDRRIPPQMYLPEYIAKTTELHLQYYLYHPFSYSFQLSSIHNQIDEMDRKLNNLEDEVHQSLIHRSDSGLSDDSINNNGSIDLPVTNSLRQSILREQDDMVTF